MPISGIGVLSKRLYYLVLIVVRMTSNTITITLPRDLATRIDNERGDVPRSLFIRRVLERTYDVSGGKKKG